jgi:hypothetical protein
MTGHLADADSDPPAHVALQPSSQIGHRQQACGCQTARVGRPHRRCRARPVPSPLRRRHGPETRPKARTSWFPPEPSRDPLPGAVGLEIDIHGGVNAKPEMVETVVDQELTDNLLGRRTEFEMRNHCADSSRPELGDRHCRAGHVDHDGIVEQVGPEDALPGEDIRVPLLPERMAISQLTDEVHARWADMSTVPPRNRCPICG